MKNQKAYDAVIRARTILLISQPFFGCLALHLQPVEVEHEGFCQTMAVDGTHLFYWPKFVLSLSEQELQGVVAHEVMHCALQHFSRCKTRNPIKWNWAGDFVINEDLLSAGFTLPKQRLHDPKYKGMSTEEVYSRLPDPPVIKIMVGGGQGDSKGGMSADADKGMCGGVIMPKDGDNHEEAEARAREWEINVRMAVTQAELANAGKLPGYLERLVKQLKKPKISWRDITRQFIDGNMTKDYSWARPNRRYVSSGLYLPGFVPDALHHMVFVGDVSGSITDKIMTAYLSEVGGALDDGVADMITTVYVDTEVRHVDEYLPGDLIQCKTHGGGGTDFKPGFDWVMKNAPDATCMIYLTDMMPCSWDLPDPGMPVLWAAWCPESYLNTVKVPFGQVIHIDDI